MRYEGTTGQIEIQGDRLVITRNGMTTKMIYAGKSDPRSIPLQAISDVALKEAGRMGEGGLQLAIGGEPLPEKVKSGHDNSVMFNGKQKEAFGQLHEWLRSVVEANRAAGVDFARAAAGVSTPTPSGETTADGDGEPTASGKEAKFLAEGVRPDIAAAAGRLGWTLGGKREIRNLAQHLQPDETVEYLAQGVYGPNNNQGIVALTSIRVLFLFHGLVNQQLEDFPIDRISSVQHKSGLGSGELTIHASGNIAVIRQIINGDLQHLVRAIRERIATKAAPAPQTIVVQAPAAEAQPDVLDQIKKLGELRDAGVLTEEEFTVKKAALLERL